jgi:hypothetical protein
LGLIFTYPKTTQNEGFCRPATGTLVPANARWLLVQADWRLPVSQGRMGRLAKSGMLPGSQQRSQFASGADNWRNARRCAATSKERTFSDGYSMVSGPHALDQKGHQRAHQGN